MDEIKQAIPLWKPHRENLYENTRYFFKGLKMKKKTIHVNNIPQASHQYNNSNRGGYNDNRGGRAR